MGNSVEKDDNPLKQWAALVSRRANQIVTKTPAAELASLLGNGVKAAMVNSWLAGYGLPENEEQHTKLMKALSLPHTADDITINMTDLQVKMAQLRITIEDLYPEALAWHREHPILIPPENDKKRRVRSVSAGSPGGNGLTSTQSQRGEFRDHPAIVHLRKHKGGAPYEALSEEQLREYLATTKNAHEYLRCYRILLPGEVIQTTIREIITNYESIETGRTRPTAEMLDQIRKHVFGNAATPGTQKAYNHFLDLTIQNRQLIINHYLRQDNYIKAMAEMGYMPPVYWREALARHLQPEAWDARNDKPAWEVQPIKTRGEFFRAIRGALGLSERELAAIFKCDSATIRNLESDVSEKSAIRDRAIAYFRREFPKLGLGAFDERMIPAANPRASKWEARLMERYKQEAERGR